VKAGIDVGPMRCAGDLCCARRSGLARFQQIRGEWWGFARANALAFRRAHASTEDASWTNQSKRETGEIQLAVRHSRASQLSRLIRDLRAPRNFRQHRPTHVVPSSAASTAQQTRGPASAEAARKLRLFKPGEIATRACTACADQGKIPMTSSRTR